MQADEPQRAFTLHASVEPTESCTTNELRLCVRLVECFHKYAPGLRDEVPWPLSGCRDHNCVCYSAEMAALASKVQ